MKTIKVLASLLCLALATSAFAGGGNCMKKAGSLAASQIATLVNEYDPEFGEYYDDGGLWYKVKLAKYSSATIWIEGGNAVDMSISVDTDPDDENAPWVYWDSEDYEDGNIQACFLYGEDWDEDDPSSGTFYVYLSGDIGAKTTLKYSEGIVSFVKVGEEDNPKSITMKDSVQTLTASAIAGAYWTKVKLTEGRKYLVWTTGGKTNATFGVTVDSGDVDETDAAGYGDAFNEAKYLYPQATATYKMPIDSMTETGKFTLHYQSIPQLDIDKHAYADLDNDGRMVAVVAGRLHTENGYYDNIVDEGLCRVSLAKGERWMFETEGARTNLEMRIYDSTGKILATNTSLDGGDSMECRAAIEVSATGYYYVGVYAVDLESTDEPPTSKVTVFAKNLAELDPPDSYDPTDDVYAGAELIAAAPGTAAQSALENGAESGPHALGGNDWYDCFKLPVVKGNVYEIVADTAEDSDIKLNLACKVFTVASGKETKITTEGSLTLYDEETGSALKFKASANTMVYIRVWVNEGFSLDYPPYHLKTLAYRTDGTFLGALKVSTKGADSKWCVTSAKYYYPNGATINVATNGGTSVTFAAVSGFATPATTVSDPIATGETTELVGVYNDTYDRYQITKNKKKVWVTDDDTTGQFSLAATSGKEKTAQRTLWATDPRDLFKFTATSGVFYNFELVGNPAEEDLGDAGMAVSDANGTVIGFTNVISKQRFDAGTYTLAVSHEHEDTPVDAAYQLKYSTFNAGTVKFAKATYQVKEDAGYVNLVVSRSAAEGAMRVKWMTAAGTDEANYSAAKPGEDYYSNEGELVWANGDKKDKTISIRLIPNLVPTVQSNKVFSVVLQPMDADEIADDEYPATILLNTAKVIIGEVTSKSAGTIAAVRYGDDETAFANQKSPKMSVVAGNDAQIVLKRSAFTALTKVAVKVTAVSDKKKYGDTAVQGQDFESYSEIIEWDDDSDDEQIVSISTSSSEDLKMSKQFTVTLAAQTKGDYAGWNSPKLLSSKITVNILNSESSAVFSTVQKEMKAQGVTLAAKGTWYRDSDGAYRSTPAASASTTFTVTGPGLFEVDPEVTGCGRLTCKIGSDEAFDCTSRVTTVIAKNQVKNGKKLVTVATSVVFTMTDEDGDSYVTFNTFDNGDTCRWVPFSGFTPDAPYYNAAITTNLTELSWEAPAELEGDLMLYRVRFGADKNMETIVTNCTVDTFCAFPAEIRLQPSKTWYWTIDCAVAANNEEYESMVGNPASIEWVSSDLVWSFTTVAADATSTKIAGVDEDGVDYLTRVENGETVRLVQGVKLSEVEMGPSEGESSLNRVLSGTLPPGLKLATGAGQGQLTGIPTTPGIYKVLLQTATGTKVGKKTVHTYATSLPITFEVAAMGSVNGSFAGTLVQDSSDLDKQSAKIGKLTFTATTAGKISATAVVAGNKYTFSGSGFDAAWTEDDDIDRVYEVTLSANRSYNKGALKVVDELTVELNDGPVTNLATFAAAAGKATLKLNVMSKTSGTGVQQLGEAEYTCTLERNNNAVEGHVAAMADFAGLYNIALAAPGVSVDDGLPAGHGYLSLKVATSGAVTVTGRLADGTAISGSAVATLHGDLEVPDSCELTIPIAFNSSGYSFGGEIVIVFDRADDIASRVDAASQLYWGKDGTSATASGEALELWLEPNGGWYNTVYNLQRYYLNRDFTLDEAEVLLNNNSVQVDTTALATVSALKYNLNRTTGMVTGTLTYAGVKKTAHYGIQFMNADSTASLANEVFAAGFFLHKVNSKWTESIPFDILMSDVIDRDWSEADASNPEE